MIRIDGADLKKFESGGLMIGTESPSSPNKESGHPGQLVEGIGFGKKKGWHRSSQNKRLFGEA